MSARNQQYIKLIGGQNLNIQDLINDQANVTKNRINVVCDTSNGVVIAILLPEIANLSGFTNLEVSVSDEAGNAAAANIIVTRGGGTDKINNGTNVVINSANGKLLFQVASNGTTTGSWTAFNTSPSAPYVPPVQANEIALIGVGMTIVLPFLPLASQHLIVSVARQFLSIGTHYTVDYLTGTITFTFGAPGDPANILYSR